MSRTLEAGIAVVGIDIGKNSFHVVGLDQRGAIALRQKWSRGQVEARFANMPPCLIGMEVCVGAHHLSRKLKELGQEKCLTPKRPIREADIGHVSSFPCYPCIISLLCRNLSLLIFIGNIAKNPHGCCVRWRPCHRHRQDFCNFP
jgi:hypothetical protein